jgi:hypothetical protein
VLEEPRPERAQHREVEAGIVQIEREQVRPAIRPRTAQAACLSLRPSRNRIGATGANRQGA